MGLGLAARENKRVRQEDSPMAINHNLSSSNLMIWVWVLSQLSIPSALAQSSMDMRKAIIERPAENLLRDSASVVPNPMTSEVGSGANYRVSSELIPPVSAHALSRSMPGAGAAISTGSIRAGTARAGSLQAGAVRAGSVQAGAVQAKVRPGKVTWHHSLREALQASRASGKPVLLFHLMGNLDEEFC